MQEFKDLEFHGSHEALKAFVEELTDKLPNGWHRAHDKEALLFADDDDPMFVFLCSEAPPRHAAGLYLAFKNRRMLYVSNIVPDSESKNQLSFDEYNRILDDFADFAAAIAVKSGLQTETTDGTWRIEDKLSPDALSKLRRFSGTTNRSTGTAHPLDQERWFDFVVSAHKNRCDLHAEDLGRWLVEEEGWPEAEASDLSIQYEEARALLLHYDGGKS